MIILLRRSITFLTIWIILGMSLVCTIKHDETVGGISLDPFTCFMSSCSLLPNQPPNPPFSPLPCDKECNVSIKVDLSWNCSDPDGDPLTYDVYLGTSTPPVKQAANISELMFDPGKLRYETTYYWYIVAFDNQGQSTEGPHWSFTTVKELHYPKVQILYPKGGETLNGTVTIQWHAYDIEDTSNLTIFLYYSRNDGETWIPFPDNPQENTGEYVWNTTTVQDGTYLLQVVAQDSDTLISHVITNPFFIRNHEEPPENQPPEKPLRPIGETSGVYKKEYPYITSTIDPDNDQIYYKWDWGDGTISDWIGPYASNHTAKTSHLWKEQGTYKIKVKARDNYGKESPWSDMLPIVMPKNRLSITTRIIVNRILLRYSQLITLWA
jgi:hypothetical protein